MSEVEQPMPLGARLAAGWRRRPWWMNLLWGFCIYSTFIYTPYDLFFKPVAGAVEVWFGVMLHDWAAKATEPLHWAIYAAGAYGFWKMRSWMWPWAALYTAQVAVGTVIWTVLYPENSSMGLQVWLVVPASNVSVPVWGGFIAGAVVAVPAIALWRARERFQGSA